MSGEVNINQQAMLSQLAGMSGGSAGGNAEGCYLLGLVGDAKVSLLATGQPWSQATIPNLFAVLGGGGKPVGGLGLGNIVAQIAQACNRPVSEFQDMLTAGVTGESLFASGQAATPIEGPSIQAVSFGDDNLMSLRPSAPSQGPNSLEIA